MRSEAKLGWRHIDLDVLSKQRTLGYFGHEVVGACSHHYHF